MFRNQIYQRAIATLLITTLNYGICAPLIAAAQTGGTNASPNPATQLIPLQAPRNDSVNNVLLPVGPRNLPSVKAATAPRTLKSSASSTATASDDSAAYVAALASLHELVQQANEKPLSGAPSAATLLASVNALRAQYNTVLQLQQQMVNAFAATQAFLTQQGVPAAILQRHQDAVTAFNARAIGLQQAMSALDAVAAGNGDAQSALTQLLQFTQQFPSANEHAPDNGKLPWGTGKDQQRKAASKPTLPAQSAREFERRFPRSVQVASNGTLSGITLPNPILDTAPTAADLAATDDVQLTPAITALAASLQNNPVAIYEYVRNNVKYQVGYGSLQGAAQTLQAQVGNDIDSASLLIALYRAAGIPARYAYGTIQVPVARLQSWLGVDNPAAAQSLLTQAGIPNLAITQGGQTSAVQVEHVWVQAYVDISPSGGARNLKPSAWVPVDPSFKQTQTQAGLPLASAVNLNQAGLFDSATVGATCNANFGQSLNQANVQAGFSAYQTQLNQLLAQQGANLTVGGVLGSTQIAPENYSILLGSLPYQTIALGATFDAIPANLQGALHLQLYADATAKAQGSAAIAYSASYADLAGKRLTFSFVPATATDAAVLAAYMPKAHSDGSPIQASEFPASIPGYLIQVSVQLQLDGQIVAAGGNFTLGSELVGVIGHYDPAGSGWNDNSFAPHAGDYQAIVSDTQGINGAQLAAVQSRLAAVQTQLSSAPGAVTADQVSGDLLNQTGLAYFATVDANAAVFQRATGNVERRLPSYGRAVAQSVPHMVFGIVDSVSFPGVTLEIDQLKSAVASQSSGLNAVAYTRQSNQRNAAYAHLVLEQHYSSAANPTPAVSAVRLLALAAPQSNPAQPVYAVTSANLAQVQPAISLTAAESADLQNAVAAGYRVLVAQHAATVGNWNGQGMAIEDPASGAGAYRISGGQSGNSGTAGNATAAIYPVQGMGWLALAQPAQAAAAIAPELSAAQAADTILIGMLPSHTDTVRWSYFSGQADVDNGLFLANLASAEGSAPSPCASLTAILAANLDTVTGGSAGTGGTTGGGSVSIPVITSAPVTAATAGQAYQYPVAASDPAGAALSYSLTSAPTGMTISSSGIVSWANPVTGISTVTVRADNGKAYAQQSYQLSVGQQALPLTISLAVSPAVINAGQSTTVTLATNGGSGTISTSLTIDGQAVALNAINPTTASATVTGSVSGAHIIKASASDSLRSVSQTSLYSVTDPADTGSPVAVIATPALDATITAPVSVTGTASDQHLAYYQLLIAPSGSNSWSEIARGYQNVSNGTLGTFDPTQLQNGIYQLTLNVVNVNGVHTSQLITLEVNSHMKIGQFHLSFQDLNIQASGIPIRITRTYDTSRRAQNLDFGQGWSIDYQNVQIRKNITLGLNWNVVSNPTALTTCLQPGQQHKIDIILPTGELAQFSASNSPSCALVNVPPINIQFTPLPGTTSSLAIDGVPQGLTAQGGVLVDQSGNSNGNTWNPQNYLLTTADNYVYHITDGIGVTSVTDPNGNTLTYGQNGILHSNGTGITFTRDANNHITAITDPSGKQINYTYSASGDLLTVNDRNNATSQMTYDTAHSLVSYTDPDGNLAARYVYDSTGKLIAAYDANGQAIQTQHNPNQDVVTDQRGNVTTYTYDNNGNITQKVDALGHTTTYTYDANGNQASVTDPAGNTTLTTSDPQSYLQTSETDALGHTNAWAYDKTTHSQLLGATDANGNQTGFTYYPSGTTLITEPLGRSTQAVIGSTGNMDILSVAGQNTNYGYDTKGNRTSETDAAGNKITYTYDANGNQLSRSWTATVNGSPQTVTSTQAFDGNGHVVSATDALGNTTQTQYTAAGQVAATIDPQGRKTSYQYGSTGKLASTTYPDGTSETNTYDASGNKITSTDRQGRSTSYQYDALNRLTQTTYPDGSTTGMTYDLAGRVATTTDAKGNVITNGNDAAGRLITQTDALGKKTQYSYDAVGNRTSFTDSLGNLTQYQYDALNRLTQTTYPDGKTSSTIWRVDGRKQSDTDQAGNVTAYGYDAVGRLNQVTQTNAATNLQTVYGYDGNGNKISQTDARGNITKWGYDASNRMTSRTLPGAQQETFAYDVNGNLIQHADFAGKAISYAYNSVDQQIQVKRADGATIVTAYTATGQVASTTVTPAATIGSNANVIQSGQTTYAYDAQDRVVKQTNPDGSFIAYAYDQNGNVTQRSTAHGTVNYAYDSNQRLTSVTDVNNQTTTYTYDSANRLATATTPDGVTTNYTYDSNNRLLQVLHLNKAGNVVGGSAYTLAANGQRMQVQEFDSLSTATSNVVSNAARTTAYTYDGLNRLTEEKLTDRTNTVVSTIDYTYDAVGNRSQKTIATAAGVEMIAYTYDANDRLIQETDTVGTTQTQTQTQTIFAWDANGNLQSKTVGNHITVYLWDSQNRLVEVDQGATQVSAVPIAKYTYDVNGNRVQKVVPGQGGLADTVTTYLVDQLFAYAQTAVETTTQGTSTSATVYTWGDGLVGLNAAGQQHYAHADALGSVKVLTDVSGNITDTYSYDAFGNAAHTGTTANPYRYTGEYFDDAIGEQNNRARWYDAQVGRFISLDPFKGHAEQPLSLNKHVYTNANPVNNVDPSGLTTMPEITIAEDVGDEVEITLGKQVGQQVTKKVGCEMLEWAAGETINYGIYILTDGFTYYVGQSNAINRRLLEHARTESKRLFQVVSRVAVPLIPGQAGKDLLSIAEQSVMDALEEEGRELANGRPQIGQNGRLRKALDAFKNICK